MLQAAERVLPFVARKSTATLRKQAQEAVVAPRKISDAPFLPTLDQPTKSTVMTRRHSYSRPQPTAGSALPGCGNSERGWLVAGGGLRPLQRIQAALRIDRRLINTVPGERAAGGVKFGFVRLLVLVCLLGLEKPSWGQDPFGGDDFGTSPSPAAAAAPASAAPTEPTDPFLVSVAALTGDTPADLLRAVELLVDYGRADEAKKYLDRLLAMKPDAAALAALHTRFRSGLFFRLANHPGLQPEGSAFADAVLLAANQAARSPEELEKRLQQAIAANPTLRRQARVDLRESGDAGINAVLKSLADPGKAAQHDLLRETLIELLLPAASGRAFAGADPLSEMVVAALESDHPEFLLQLIDVTSELRLRNAIPALVRLYTVGPGANTAAGSDSPAADAASLSAEQMAQVKTAAGQALQRLTGRVPEMWEAEAYLERACLAQLQASMVPEEEQREPVVRWEWNRSEQQVVARVVVPADAALVDAARLARELYRLSGAGPRFQRIYLTANLASEKALRGSQLPLPDGPGTMAAMATAAGTLALEGVLAESLEKGYVMSALAALELLAKTGDKTLVASADGQPRPLVVALRHEDPQVRFAAAETILALDPPSSFPGGSYLPEVLTYFAGSSGTRRVLIVDPRNDRGTTLAGMLVELGFEADTCGTGREALRMASRYPDYQFALLSSAIGEPPIAELCQQLRRDPLTRKLPLGVMESSQTSWRLEGRLEGIPLVEIFPRPHSAATLSDQVARLLRRAGRDRLDVEDRTRQAKRALAGLAQLAKDPHRHPTWDIMQAEDRVRRALETPYLAVDATAVLGYLATPTAQRTLVTLASQPDQPLAVRQAAADAFREAAKRRGILLTRGEILQQYAVYNRSAELDEATQQVLGQLLDTLESPRSPPSRPAPTISES